MGRFLQMLTVFVTTVSLQGWLPLGCLDEERIALLQLKDSLNYPNGTSLPSWMEADAHCCSWERIECNSSTGRVTLLGLDSTRNEEMGDWYLNTSLFLPFQQLNALYLGGNRIVGWIEKKGGYELQRLKNLDFLHLGSNSFDNSILSFVEGFPSFKSLYLSYNRLEGLIDLKESLSSLEVLGLSGNNINKLVASRGPSNLTTLYLHNITVYESSFQLLQSLGAFPNLMTLYLRFNDFRGRILGDELQNLSSLESLYLDWCSLDEHSLQSLGALPSLKNLSLQALSGRVPSGGFFDLNNLEYLDLSYNTLNNSIFQAIGMMTSLKTLIFRSCKLDGRIPTAQGFLNLKNLEVLDLSSNTLDNSIFQTIEFFSVAHNNLSGKTPARVAQFATFEESCYKDNPFLCGEPLPKICGAAMPSSPTPTSTNNEDDGGFIDMEVFYVTFGVAYIMVLLVIGAVLYINPYWRRAWFHFIEASINNCYYFLVDNLPVLFKF